MDYRIRPAAARDASGILGIYAPIVKETAISFELEPPSVDEMGRRIEAVDGGHVWLVADGPRGGIAGYAYASAFRPRPAYRFTAEVSVAVSAEHRQRGLGRALYGALLDELSRGGFHSAIAVIALPNAASVALHDAMGFRRVGVLEEVGFKLNGWRDVELWQRRLDLVGPRRTP